MHCHVHLIRGGGGYRKSEWWCQGSDPGEDGVLMLYRLRYIDRYATHHALATLFDSEVNNESFK